MRWLARALSDDDDPDELGEPVDAPTVDDSPVVPYLVQAIVVGS